uniref:Uncharacterized protein n=1 Tax=Erpetoichthys calabaricus TaxID=27687 RepID=A0A8C4RE78_ERPCA
YLSSTCYLTLSRFQSPESNSEFNINIQRDQNGHFIKIMITVDKVDTEIENGTISVDGQSISLPYDQKTIHIHKYGIFTRLQSRRGFLSVFWETQGSITDKVWVSLTLKRGQHLPRSDSKIEGNSLKLLNDLGRKSKILTKRMIFWCLNKKSVTPGLEVCNVDFVL